MHIALRQVLAYSLALMKSQDKPADETQEILR
jgi:hypothetical protein